MKLHHSIVTAFTACTLLACVEDAADTPTSDAGAGGNGSATTGGGGDAGPGGATSSAGGSGSGGAPGTSYVFTMSNAPEANEIIVFERAADGSLSARESVPTGGAGSGDGLGSQGALAVSPSGDFVYVVNAGSHQLSAFRIYDDHLALVDLVPSGGDRPVSVTASDDHVYVVHAGTSGGVQGFDADGGALTPISGGARPLSGSGSGPAQLGLTPAGDALIVTEKATNSLLTYWVAPDGSLSEATVTASEGNTPFGFDFAPDGTLVVSEAFGGNAGESAASSYTIGGVEPEVISSSVPSGQTAACWLLIAQGTFAYTTNTASNTISGYHLDSDGMIALFDDDGETAILGADNSPLDMALSSNHDFLYVLNGKSDVIMGFSIDADGGLDKMDDELPIPEASVGLAAR